MVANITQHQDAVELAKATGKSLVVIYRHAIAVGFGQARRSLLLEAEREAGKAERREATARRVARAQALEGR